MTSSWIVSRAATPGFSGADLENLVNEAALLAARRNKEKVEQGDFELAKDKVMMGAERRSMVMSMEERRNTAYHEAGHALVGMLLPGADPVHKVTIIPRGMALGVTQQLPVDDRYTYSREYLMTRLSMMFGGRAAEELIFGHMTTGAGDDIEKATELSRKMVCEWGMSKELGPMTFGRREEQVFLGRDIGHQKDYSEHTAVEIDREVRRIIEEAYQQARSLLSEHIKVLHAVAEQLLEKEVLDGAQVAEILKAYREGREPFDGSRSEPNRREPSRKPVRKNPRSRRKPRCPGCLRSRSSPSGARLRKYFVRYQPPFSSQAEGRCCDQIPGRDGHSQCHAGFLFRWRPFPRSGTRRRSRAGDGGRRRRHHRHRRRIDAPDRCSRSFSRWRNWRGCGRCCAAWLENCGCRFRSIPAMLEVARAALDEGAAIINDVTALADPAMATLAADSEMRRDSDAYARRTSRSHQVCALQ